MASRPRRYRLLVAATALVAVAAGNAARAQNIGTGSSGVGLRNGDVGEPLDPRQNQPPLSAPERPSPLPANPSSSAADEQAPSSLQPQNQPDDIGPNYGKARKRKPKLSFKQKTKGSNLTLSPLVPYRGSPGTKKVLNPQPAAKDAIDPAQPSPSVAVIQSPLRYRRVPSELDPFRPTGVRVGELILRPYVETSAGYSTNPNQVQYGVKSSPALRAEGGLDVESDFSASRLGATIRGGYTEYPANKDASRPDFDGVIRGEVEVTRQDRIETEARASLQTITPGSIVFAGPTAVNVVNRPLISSEGLTLGGTHQFGRLSVGLRGTFDRTQYGDAQQSDGTTLNYSRDNYNDYGVVLRATYELSPAITPFVESGADSRVRDNPIDNFGFRRNSTGISGKAGIIVDLFGHLTGSVDGGYLQREYVDRRLPLLVGPVVDAQLIYRASALTTVTMRASTFAAETILPGASGAITRSVGLEVSHLLFRHFTLTGIALVQPDEYQGVRGRDLYTTFSVKGVYALSREVALTFTATRQGIRSSFAGQSFVDTTALVGVRLQR